MPVPQIYPSFLPVVFGVVVIPLPDYVTIHIVYECGVDVSDTPEFISDSYDVRSVLLISSDDIPVVRM